MSPEQILKYLQMMFPDRLVLYSADLAKILGVSEKALAHLVERGRFPFAVKLVGYRRCVDIFQVAEWLASRDAFPDQQDVEALGSVATKSKSIPVSAASGGAVSKSMSKRLIAMRQTTAAFIAQQFGERFDTHEAKFWIEIAEHLAMFQFFIRQGCSVKLRWIKAQGERASQGERVSYFVTLDEAFSFVVKSKQQLSEFNEASVTIRSGDRKIYHAIKLNDWINVVGAADLATFLRSDQKSEA